MPQLLGTRSAFTAIAIGKTTQKLTQKLAAHVETSSVLVGETECPHVLLSETAEAAVSPGCFSWAVS